MRTGASNVTGSALVEAADRGPARLGGVRFMRHPGPAAPVRLETAVEPSARALRLAIPAGVSLIQGVTEALGECGVTSATMTLMGGRVERLVYVLAREDETHERVVALSEPITVAGATLLTGSGTVGLDQEGQPLVHCHAVFGGEGAAFGGHLIVGQTIMGTGSVAYLRGLTEISIEALFDEEINVAIFRPAVGGRTLGAAGTSLMKVESGRAGRIAYTRVRPNEDLVQAVQKVCMTHGFRNAFVRGSLGSLTDACLADAEGDLRELRGPAIEVLSITGEVRSDAGGGPEAHLSGVVADAEGRVTGGRFVSGRNPVCMTFELALEEWLPDRVSEIEVQDKVKT